LIDPKTNKTIGFYTFDNQKTIANYTSRQNIKRKDFAKFNITLYDNFNVTLPKNSRNISSHFKLLEPVFIKKDDIEFMIEKMYYFLEKSKTSDHKYTIFSEEELYKLTNDTIEFIKQKFKESNLNNIKTKKVWRHIPFSILY